MRIRVRIPAIPPMHVSKRRKPEKMGGYFNVRLVAFRASPQ
jgi:hypothetical protein